MYKFTQYNKAILNTPAIEPEDSRIVINSTVHIDSAGYASVDYSKQYFGNMAQSKRYSLRHLDRDETATNMNFQLPDGRKKFELIDYSINELENRYSPLGIDIKAKRKRQRQ